MFAVCGQCGRSAADAAFVVVSQICGGGALSIGFTNTVLA